MRFSLSWRGVQRWAGFWVLALALFLSGLAGAGAEEAPEEYAIKTAYIYSMVKFVKWPLAAFEHDPSHFSICIVGPDPFKELVTALSGRAVEERKIVINYLPQEQEEAIGRCQVAFFEDADASSRLLTALADKPVLTISDSGSAAMVTFVNVDSRVRFRINQELAKGALLSVSAQLMKLALPD